MKLRYSIKVSTAEKTRGNWYIPQENETVGAVSSGNAVDVTGQGDGYGTKEGRNEGSTINFVFIRDTNDYLLHVK